MDFLFSCCKGNNKEKEIDVDKLTNNGDNIDNANKSIVSKTKNPKINDCNEEDYDQTGDINYKTNKKSDNIIDTNNSHSLNNKKGFFENQGFSFAQPISKNSNKLELSNLEKNQILDKKDTLIVVLKTKSEEEEIKIKKEDREGVTYFGKSKENEIENASNSNKSTRIDLCLKFSSNIPENTAIFKTYYDSSKKRFMFKTLENNSSLIVQVKINPSNKWVICKEDKFLIGDMILKFEPNEKELTITRLVTKRHPQRLTYSCKASDGIITIGRSKNCSFTLESNLMSRVHASIFYNENSHIWEFKDGEFSRPSANGCFLFTSNSIEIVDKLEIKVNEDTVYFFYE